MAVLRPPGPAGNPPIVSFSSLRFDASNKHL
jgi:hypothetical protein